MTYESNHAWNQEHYTPEAMRYGRTRAPHEAVEPLSLEPEQKVKFYGDRRWWTVQGTRDDWVLLTRQGEFGRGLLYTVISWSQGRRGPHGSWGYVVDNSPEKTKEVLTDLASGEIEMSERHSVRLDIERVK